MLIDNLSPARICAASTEAGYKKPWCPIYWEADKTTSNWDEYLADDQPGRLRASMHLPRAFSRINLRVTGVKIERLQDISEADAKVEGVEFDDFNEAWTDYGHDIEERYWRNSATESFKSLWELINGQGSWAANPWVAATSFERVE